VRIQLLLCVPKGTIPTHLLQRGIYSQIAIALKGGAWRDTSMVLLAKALGMSIRTRVSIMVLCAQEVHGPGSLEVGAHGCGTAWRGSSHS
jgi:hypothetical protein